MRTLFVYLAIVCVVANVASNAMNNTAQGLQDMRTTRAAQLCSVNPIYCD
jgi:hypothetical protein